MLISSALHCDHPVINTLLQGSPTLCQGVQGQKKHDRVPEDGRSVCDDEERHYRRLFDVAFCLLNSRF
jgi:hypothetical protein